MKTATTEKIVTLVLSFVIFIGGVLALSMDRGNGRTITLAMLLAALLGIGAKVTFARLKKKK